MTLNLLNVAEIEVAVVPGLETRMPALALRENHAVTSAGDSVVVPICTGLPPSMLYDTVSTSSG